MQKIVSHLKSYREEKGISQEQLAEAIGVSRKTISLMESEKECNPRIQTAYRLVKYLELTMEQVFECTEENETEM